MKSVVVSPARNSGVRRVATRKSRLVVRPWIAVLCSACASLPAASRRVGPWAMTLAIMGSNSMLISLPDSTPESNLAWPTAEGRQTRTRPGAGRKPLAGSSAYSRASMAQPLMLKSSWRNESGSPSAMRICSRTRSWPMMASVTGCSTCRRAFTSRKWKSSSCSMNSTVPADE